MVKMVRFLYILTLDWQLLYRNMEVRKGHISIMIKSQQKGNKSFKIARQARTPHKAAQCRPKKRGIDITKILKKMHDIELSIYQEQISSIKAQKKTENKFMGQLDFFWSDLLSHLSPNRDQNEQQREGIVNYEVSYIKRQGIVANQIARYRSESSKVINELAEKELQMIKIYSSKRKFSRAFASLPK